MVILRTLLYLPLFVLLLGCVSLSKYTKLEHQYEVDTAALKQVNEELVRENSLLRNQKNLYATKVDALNNELQLMNTKYRALEQLSEQSKRDIEEFKKIYPMDVSIGPQGQVVLRDKLLFASGSADLTKKGEKALDDFSNTVLRRGGLYLKIVGHTDSDPIKKSAKKWRTKLNHELGAARAIAVLDYLVRKCKFNPKYAHVESYGEFRPLVDNKTAKNKALNRRVEIFIYPIKELK